MKKHSSVDVITNSSSTTFIVAFPKLPENEEEMKNFLFPDEKDLIRDVDGDEAVICGFGVRKTKDIASQIFQNMLESERIKSKKELRKGLNLFEWQEEWSDEELDTGAPGGSFKNWWNSYKDDYLFVFRYYDAKDDYISEDERNIIFKHLPNMMYFT